MKISKQFRIERMGLDTPEEWWVGAPGYVHERFCKCYVLSYSIKGNYVEQSVAILFHDKRSASRALAVLATIGVTPRKYELGSDEQRKEIRQVILENLLW